jgi:hypothetical protein
MQGNVARH